MPFYCYKAQNCKIGKLLILSTWLENSDLIKKNYTRFIPIENTTVRISNKIWRHKMKYFLKHLKVDI